MIYLSVIKIIYEINQVDTTPPYPKFYTLEIRITS